MGSVSDEARGIRRPLWGAEGGGAVVNDMPVACQSRGVTEPAGENLPLSSLRNSRIVLG